MLFVKLFYISVRFKKENVGYVIVIMWILVLIIFLLGLLLNNYDKNLIEYLCNCLWILNKFVGLKKIYILIFCFLCMIIFMFVILFCYFFILYGVYFKKNICCEIFGNVVEEKLKKCFLKLFVFLVVIFVVCCLLFVVFFLYVSFIF